MTTASAPRARAALSTGIMWMLVTAGLLAQIEGIVDLAVAEGQPRPVVPLARAVAPDRLGGSAEEVEEPVDHALERGERAVAPVEQDGARPVPFAGAGQPLGGEAEGLVPPDGRPAARRPHERPGDPLGVVLPILEEVVHLVAQRASGDGVIGIALDAQDAVALDLGDHAAGVEAIERA